MSLNRPNFFIVGAPRCGTTAMYDYLKVHPDISMSSYKEPHYFGRDLVGLRYEIFRDDEQKYLRLFEEHTTAYRIGEASVYYLYSKQAARELHDFNPTAHILIMLRSPIEVLHSLFYQSKLTGDNPYDTPEDLIANTDPIMADKTINSRIKFLTGDGVRYYEQVKRYLDVFGKDQVHIVIYDEFRADTPTVYQRALEFLAVDSTFRPESFDVVNPSKKVRNPLIHRITSSQTLIKLGMKLPLITIPIYRAIKVLNSTKHDRPPLSDLLIKRLKTMLHDDVIQLSQLIDRDLSHWVKYD